MKKSLRMKGLMTLSVVALVSVLAAVGCAPNGSAGESAGSSSSIDESAYPVHAANSEGGPGIASYHVALGQDCESCHGDDLPDQVAAISSDGELELASTYYTDTETCLSSGCHDSWESLAKRTEDLGEYNPHDSIHGTIESCNECHKGHAEQVDICGECHSNGGQTMLS